MKKIFLLLLLGGILLANGVATITALKGTAHILRDAKQIDATLGAKLKTKDSIITQDDTKLQLIFQDDTIITIGNNSNFSISKYLFDEKNEPIASFGLLKGVMRTITGKIGKTAPHRFKVKTKTATIGIRGTNFTLLAGEDNTQSVYCTFGAIVVHFNNKEYLIKEGNYIYIGADKKVFIRKFTSEQLKKKKSRMKDYKTIKEVTKIDTDGDTVELFLDLKDEEIVEEFKTQEVEAAQSDEDDYVKDDYIEVVSSGDANDALHPYKGIRITNDISKNADENSIKYIYTFVKKPQDDMQDFYSIAMFDKDNHSQNIDMDIKNIFVQTQDDLSADDSMEWGRWNVVGANQTELNGLWIWGNLSDADIIATYKSKVHYDGIYRAIDADKTTIDGQAFLDVDFANDTASLNIKKQNSTSSWAKYSDMKLVANSISGSQDGGTGGFATGAFYEEDATSVGGNFTINDSKGQREANGVYQVLSITKP